MRNQKGITLVALVVTIVVLLILAGTSIAMLAGDSGIITNAQQSKAANTEGEVVDKIKMAFNTIKTEVVVKSSINADYNAQAAETEKALAQTIVDELGLSATIVSGTATTAEKGYSVLYTATSGSTAGTIVVTYTDSMFGSTGDYNAIEMTITIQAGNVTLADYDMQSL